MQGFLTINFFPGGRKDGEAEEYNGGRTSSVSLVADEDTVKRDIVRLGYRRLGVG